MPTSKPQGDPLSTMITTLLLRAWIMQMESLAAHAKVLGDDLQILCAGPNDLKIFEDTFTKTHKRLKDMGAKLAPSKSPTFSTDDATMDWLRTHRWRRPGRTVEVKTGCRHLGAQLNTASIRWYGETLATRMQQVGQETDRLSRIKAPYDKKTAIARLHLSTRQP